MNISLVLFRSELFLSLQLLKGLCIPPSVSSKWGLSERGDGIGREVLQEKWLGQIKPCQCFKPVAELAELTCLVNITHCSFTDPLLVPIYALIAGS